MGLDERGMQPFCLGGDYVVCNGELYGFRPLRERLKEKYTFVSESDCEILLPLYHEYGLEMFRALDAEFALVIYDAEKNSLIAARDPIGIRPLYYGEIEGGGMAFASEPKDLVGLCEAILPFPPGCYWADGQFVRYADAAHVDQFAMVDEETACVRLRDLLIEGVKKRLDADAPIGFLLSGGLDSSLVCAIAQRELGKPIRTFAIGMDVDAIDLKYARQVAEYIGSDTRRSSSPRRTCCGRCPRWWNCSPPTTSPPSAPAWACTSSASISTSIRTCAYSSPARSPTSCLATSTRTLPPAPPPSSARRKKRVRELHMYDVLRADRCISVNSLEARVPFGDLAFVRYAMSIDPALKMNRHGMGKYLLRKAFARDGLLPENISGGRRRPFQTPWAIRWWTT